VNAETSRRTVLIVAAGCAAGGALAEGFAARGDKVIVADHDERRVLALARHAPRSIENLTLDPLHPGHCRCLGTIWADTPLDLLVHLHALRRPRRAGAAVAAIPALTRGLGRGLERGEGLVMVACRAPQQSAMPEAHAFDAALTALAPHMQAEAGRRARINVLRLAPGTGCVALAQAVTRLAEQRQNGPRGAVLDLGWAGDGTRAQAD
jgi:NAD(P)-dependent dehydrogenase (short-subunit alcohol dehydrogenase family)